MLNVNLYCSYFFKQPGRNRDGGYEVLIIHRIIQ